LTYHYWSYDNFCTSITRLPEGLPVVLFTEQLTMFLKVPVRKTLSTFWAPENHEIIDNFVSWLPSCRNTRMSMVYHGFSMVNYHVVLKHPSMDKIYCQWIVPMVSWDTWLWTMSMERMDNTHAKTPWTLPTLSIDNVYFIHGQCPISLLTMSMLCCLNLGLFIPHFQPDTLRLAINARKVYLIYD
jgi:hypothetical protein